MYEFFSPDVQDLLHGLLRRDPAKRITNAADVKKHRWFKKINWIDVQEKKIKPTFKPVVKSDEDCSNIDMQFLREDIKETMPMKDMSSFHTRQQNHYVNFTMVARQSNIQFTASTSASPEINHSQSSNIKF